MSAREWKPGDVALVIDSRGRSGRAMRGVIGWDFTPSGSSLNAYSGEEEPIEAHPLVVIDPRRLTWDGRIPSAAEFTAWAESLPAGEFATGVLIVADALRDLPDVVQPKPDEPMGKYAVVEDTDGVEWVRIDPAGFGWQRLGDPSTEHNAYASWDGFDAVRVLSEGVPS